MCVSLRIHLFGLLGYRIRRNLFSMENGVCQPAPHVPVEKRLLDIVGPLVIQGGTYRNRQFTSIQRLRGSG